MSENTTGRGSTIAAVLACLLVVGSALAVGPGTAAAAHIDGEISYSGADGELTVAIDAQNDTESFNGTGAETVTIDIGGASVNRTVATGSSSTYTYTVERSDLAELDVLSGTDGSNTRVTVSHDGEPSFNETVDIQYVELEGSGEFTDDGRLRFPVGTNFGVAAGNTVPVEVETDDWTRNATATYRVADASNASYLVLNRNTLGTLGILRNPQGITVSGGASYVQGSATVNVASAGTGRTTGERLSGGTVRFESPLFESGQRYAVNVSTGNARYLRTVEAGTRAIEIQSWAVAAESSVTLTVTHVNYTQTQVVSTRIEFRNVEITGNATGGTVVFDSLPNVGSGIVNVTVWAQAEQGLERYDARLNTSTRTLTLSNAESLSRPENATRTGLVIQFDGGRTLYATVSFQSDGGGGTPQQPGSGGLFEFLPTLPLWVWILLLGGPIVVAGIVYGGLRMFGSGTTRINIPWIGSSKRNSPGTSPGTSPGPETTEVSFNVVDEVAGRTYHNADRVTATPNDQTGGARRQGINTNETEQIDLTRGEGTAELECREWVFEVEQNGRTIGRRVYRLNPQLDRDRLALSVEPYTVDVRVTGGPDREPLGGATVEVTDGDRWGTRTPTDPEGRVQFEVPRSASTISFTATYEDLPPAEAEYQTDRAAQEGVTLRIANETGSMTVETAVGDRPWPGVDVRITPVSEDAKAYTDEGTVTTKSGGRRTVEGLPVGEYEIAAHPQLDGVETTSARESVTVAADEAVEVTLSIGISYSTTAAQRERLEALRGRIEELTAASNRDVAIPRYYGTVLTSVLDLVEDIESSPERVVGIGISPDTAVDAVLDAVEAGISTVDGAMSERRNVSLFGACESMPPAEVDWSGDATLEEYLDRVDDGGDHGRRALRDRLKEIDDVLDQRWGEVNEIAPARKVHDRVGDLARETGDIDDEPTVVAQTYVGICLLDAVEGIFDHDALVERLNSGSY